MFLGHYGVAFALKRAEPKVSLGVLFLAVQMVDLLWGVFLLTGWEHVRLDPGAGPLLALQFTDYPITHSLVGGVAWALVAMALYYSWPTRDTSRHWEASGIVGLAVFSHYWLDVIVHVPDLTIAGEGTPALGLGLWRNLPATLAVELLLLGAGIAVYVLKRSRKHPIRAGRLTGLAIVLVALYLASLFGPPPPSVKAIAVMDIAGLLLLAVFAGWVDRRVPGTA